MSQKIFLNERRCRYNVNEPYEREGFLVKMVKLKLQSKVQSRCQLREEQNVIGLLACCHVTKNSDLMAAFCLNKVQPMTAA